MAQHDYIIANQSGAAFRSDLNNGLAAIVSQNSGAAQPSTTYAYQWWADTTTGLLKLRNAANNAWITVGTLASANLGLIPAGAASIVNADVNASAGIVASKLSFTQSGTGAAARTIDSKLKDVVSVKDFGAVADGVYSTGAGTNNTAAFQAAIDSLTSPLVGGKSLYVPAGIYKLASAITIPSGISVIGDGPWSSILFAPTAFSNTSGLVQINGAGNSPTRWDGVSVLAQTGGCTGYGLVSTANGVLIRNIWCSGYVVGVVLGAQTGMLLSDAFIELNTTNLLIQGSDIQVSDVEVYEGQNGVTISNNAFTAGNGRVTLTNVQAASTVQNGFSVSNAKNVALIGCSAAHVNNGRYSNSGLLIDTSTDVTISGFDAQIGSTASTTSTGIKVIASTRVSIVGGSTRGFLDGISTSASGDILIEGVISTGNGRSGIYLNAGSRITVCGCTARSNGTAGVNDYGIQSANTDANSTHTLIGNTCTDVSGGVQNYGIAATVTNASSYTIIDGNLCQNSGTADIFLDGAASYNVKLGKANIAGSITETTAPAMASAATLTLPLGADVVSVTGTTGITSITATGNTRRTVTLIFAAALTVTDGSNLKLAGNFTTTADDTLTLYCDGTNWIEIARSVN